MHICGASDDQETTGPLAPLDPDNATAVEPGRTGTLPPFNGSSFTHFTAWQGSPLLTVGLGGEHYTYEALCTAGVASITLKYMQCERDREQHDDDEQHDTLHTGNVRESHVGAGRCLVLDRVTIGGSSQTDSRPLRLFSVAAHEGMASPRKHLSFPATATAAGMAADNIGWRSENRGDEDARNHGDDASSGSLVYSRSSTATAASTRTAHSSSSSPPGCAPGDGDVLLDILEEVEVCNLVPLLPRTFATEQLVQQIVPCTYFFGPPKSMPSHAECVPSARHSRDGANAMSTHAFGEWSSVSPICASPKGGCLAHVRRVSDQHTALLRAVANPPIMPEAVAQALRGDSEAAVDDVGVSRTWMALPSVPVYMQATSLAACGDSNDKAWVETHITQISSGDYSELPKGGGIGKKGLAPLASSVVGEQASPVLCQESLNCNEDNVKLELVHSEAKWRDTIAASAVSPRSGGSSFVHTSGASSLQLASEAILSVRSPMSRGVCTSTTTREDVIHRTYAENGSGLRHGDSVHPHSYPSPLSSLASALEDSVVVRSHEAGSPCTSFIAAQARYAQHRRLLLQGHGGSVDFFTNHRTDNFAHTNSLHTDATRPIWDRQSAAPPPCAAGMSNPTEGLDTTDKSLLTSAQPAAPFTSFIPEVDVSADSHMSATAVTETNTRNAGLLPSRTASSRQCGGVPLLLPLTLASSAPRSTCQQQQQEQHSLLVHQGCLGGALVEWSSGIVSYTSDTLGLYEEQKMRSRRFYCLPPPFPTARLALGGPVQDSTSVGSRVPAEDRSNLRGAVFAQLQRLSRVRKIECALSHGAVSSEGKYTAVPRTSNHNTTPSVAAAASSSCASPRPSHLVMERLSPILSRSSSPPPPTAISEVSSPVHKCRCYRCLPLLVQFAQVPSLSSPVLRRYLDTLHQRALPEFLSQPRRHGASQAAAAPEVGSAPSQEEEIVNTSAKRVLSSMKSTSSARGVSRAANVAGDRTSRGQCHRRWRGHTNCGPQCYEGGEGEMNDVADSVKTASGAKRIKRETTDKCEVAPTASASLKAGVGVQRSCPADEALGVFPALQQWFAQIEKRGGMTHRTSPNTQRRGAELVSAVPLTDDVALERDSAYSRHAAQTAPIFPQHHGETCASREPGVDSVSYTQNALAGSAVGSLDWVDDAVLDEVVVVGVVPRDHPHELKLVAPSRAFCMALTQRLEEVAEAAVQILAFIAPPHEPLPSDILGAMRGESRRVSTTHRASSHDTTTTTSADDWRAWLEEQYFTSMWATLRLRLTAVEWQTVLQGALGSPFLARWATAAAAGSVCPSATFPSDALHTEASSVPSATHENSADRSSSQAKQRIGDIVYSALRDVRASVRSAAELHTSACLSAAEDLVTRVVLTALVPILHRRITVMYELLRHFSSKSLYTSHRQQCDAYQHWYSMTPSPASVLRLLQRSGRYCGALGRCYPQYDLFPEVSSPPRTSLPGVREEKAMREAAAAMSYPRCPRSCVADKAEVPTAATNGTATQSDVSTLLGSGHTESSGGLNGSSAPHAGDFPVRRRAIASSPAGVEDGDNFFPSSSPSSPTATTVPAAAASAWMSSPLSPCDERSSPQGPLQQEPQVVLMYVPEAALLEPRYLQRFAWWMHRTHHGAGASGLGSSVSINSDCTGGAGLGAQPSSRAPNTVLSIPGDYLRVLPLQEQDASIRIVLRSMAQKGRTLGLWEMRQHIRQHVSYVYH